MSSLSENENKNVQYHPVNNKYRFGHGKLSPHIAKSRHTSKSIMLKIKKVNESVMLNTDVAASDIPLFLSTKSTRHDT